MANTKEFKEIKDKCYEQYLAGTTDVIQLAATFGVKKATVTKWIKVGGWDTLEKSVRNLEKDIQIARKKALLQALRAYATDPNSTNLQSLTALLKQEMKHDEPSKELNDYILKLADQTTDFLIEKGDEKLLKMFQEVLLDLCEYLRARNS